jgi:hypothetical protein
MVIGVGLEKATSDWQRCVAASARDAEERPVRRIMFVDLPNQEERESIWEIQIQKYERNAKEFDLAVLAQSHRWIDRQ